MITMSSSELKDYYGLLGIAGNSTVSEIHKAYWHRASRCHPDMGGSHEEMVQLVEAWKILSDPEKRARYDQLLRFRKDGWHSNKFNADVQDARTRAKADAACSWAEFEAIYQKAFYTFNQDFYGAGLAEKSSGPYSPLMGSGKQGVADRDASKSRTTTRSTTSRTGATMVDYMLKIVILIATIVVAFVVYQNYSGIGRYVPLGQTDSAYVLMLDTTSGAVYAIEKRGTTVSPAWKEAVVPLAREKKFPGR